MRLEAKKNERNVQGTLHRRVVYLLMTQFQIVYHAIPT